MPDETPLQNDEVFISPKTVKTNDVAKLAQDDAEQNHTRRQNNTISDEEILGLFRHAESGLVDRYVQLIQSVHQNVRDALRQQDELRAEIDASEGKARIKSLPHDLEKDIGNLKTKFHLSLNRAWASEDQANVALQRFKALHQRKFPAKRAGNKSTHFTVLTVMVALESILNSVSFAAGDQSGLLGGFQQAIVVSLINLFFGLLICTSTRYSLLQTPRSLKNTALIGIPIAIALMLVFNLLVAHYRGYIELDPLESARLTVAAFLEGPLSVPTPRAWFLCLIGISFSMSFAAKFFLFEDPYPGYAQASHRLDEAAAEHDDIKDELVQLIQSAEEERLSQIAKNRRALMTDMSKFESSVDRSKAWIDQFSGPYAEQVKKEALAAIDRYRRAAAEHVAALKDRDPGIRDSEPDVRALDLACAALHDYDLREEEATIARHQAVKDELQQSEFNDDIRAEIRRVLNEAMNGLPSYYEQTQGKPTSPNQGDSSE